MPFNIVFSAVEAFGATSLVQARENYSLYPNGGAAD
jgi:hypothetical protein